MKLSQLNKFKGQWVFVSIREPLVEDGLTEFLGVLSEVTPDDITLETDTSAYQDGWLVKKKGDSLPGITVLTLDNITDIQQLKE